MEVTFHNWIYSMFSTPPEKTFVDWFYTADRQESPLALWQDPSLWGFFWFVLLLPKILDFLVIWLWRKLQDNNCHKEKVKSFCCLPKLPSRMKLNQTKGDYTRFDTVSHFKDRQVADRSLSKDPNKMRNCSTNLIVKSKAESFPKLVLPPHKVCRTIHSPPPRPCAASPPPALRETVVYQVVRVIRFTRQMTGGERLVFTQQIQFSAIMNSFQSGLADVHIQVMEMVSSSHRIAIGGSGKMMQLMKAPEIGDQKQHLKSSEEQAAVMEMVSSSHRIAIEGSGEMMQLMKAPEIGDQMQHLKSRHSVLPLLHEPQAKKATMKKKDLTIPDRPESRRHPQLRSDIEKVTEEYGNGIVTIRECEDIDEVFIDLHLEIWVMQKVSMMEESLPLLIRLGFSLSKYIDGDEPSVELIVPNKEGYFINLFLMESMLKTFLASRWKRWNVHPPKYVKLHRIVSRFLKHAHSLFKPTYRRNRKKVNIIPIQDYALLPLSEQGILLEVMHHVIKNAEALRGIHTLFDAPYIPKDKVLKVSTLDDFYNRKLHFVSQFHFTRSSFIKQGRVT
uniref:uncharacterized protein n=1 Tax=Myxine glutinosa TaxID=7769 RepID=UPI00358E17DE